MFRVFSCLTGEHDWRLVVLAGVVCLLASIVAISLFHRARAVRGRARGSWLALAGTATGCGIWATHFIAMLAYQPNVAVAYDISLTVLSLLAAALVTFAGLSFAVSSPGRFSAPIGGAIIGAGIASMHYTGMLALELPGHVAWGFDLVLASIALGVLFGAAAMAVAVRDGGMHGTLGAAVLLTLAIVSHHFTAMGAVTIIPDPTRTITPTSLSEPMLAFGIAAAAMAVLGMSLIGAIADSSLSKRNREFAQARRQLIADWEQKVRDQNARLDTALNNMSQGICMFDESARIVVYNRRYLEMYSLSPLVVQPGCTLLDLIRHRKDVGLLDVDPEQYCRKILDGVATGQVVTFTMRATDGRLIQAVNRPMPGGSWITIHEDVTERLRAEEQLREQKVQLDTALNNMSQGLLMFDRQARLALCNQRYLQMYDLSPDQVTPGCTLKQLLELRKTKGTFASDPDSYIRDLQAALAEGKPVTLTTELRDRRIISVVNSPLPDGQWVSTHEDITEARRAEERLRDQKLQLDTALSNMSHGLVMFDKDLRMVMCNRRYIEMYGLPPDIMTSRCTIRELMIQHFKVGVFNGNAEKYADTVVQEVTTGEAVNKIVETADGRIISIVNRTLEDGGRIATHEDITERHRQKLLLDTALNNMSQGLNMFDADGRLMVCNQRYLQMYRLSADIVKPGCTVHDLVQARIAAGTFFTCDPEKYITQLLGAMAKREPNSAEMELSDGRVVAVQSQPTLDGKGWVVTHADVTERRHAEKERDRSQAFAATVIENVPATIMVKDARDLRYMLLNRAGEEYLGMSRDKMIGKTAAEVFDPATAERIANNDREILQNGQAQFYDEHPVTTPGGNSRIVTTSRTLINDPQGAPLYLMTVVEDRTHRKRAEAQIAHMAHHDSLTGLPNRAAFNECLASTLEVAAEQHESFALLSIDLDRFKEINDVFGYAVGDELLREMSIRLQGACGGAFVARLGADEFIIIAADGEQPAAAEALADQLLTATSDEFTVDSHRLRVKISVGIGIFPTDGTDAASLIANANAALYRAKADGGSTFRFFEADMDKRLRERRALQHELQSAIERGELILHYQPQATIGGEVTGFEALVRWHHPTRGIIPPGTFIPLAEESGLIGAMGEWILREACQEAASWPKPLRIAINLSPVQFRHGDLPGLVHSVLLDTGLAPARLELEITESVLIGDFSRAVSILRRLKALGVRIAMDDFGTGYSSLSYLQSFPFDKIKIDQAFISNVQRNQQSATIIRAVIGLARGLKLPVVAEGVETKDQLEFLSDHHCNEIQGFLIGRPQPIDSYRDLVGLPKQPRRVARAR